MIKLNIENRPPRKELQTPHFLAAVALPHYLKFPKWREDMQNKHYKLQKEHLDKVMNLR